MRDTPRRVKGLAAPASQIQDDDDGAFTLTCVAPPQAPASDIDWPAIKRRILDGLDVAAEYENLGVRFVDRHSRGDRLECYALRESGNADDSPSAVVFLRSGVYFDSGDGGTSIGFFEFAMRHGDFGRWIDCIKHYADIAEVELPRGCGTSRKAGKILESTHDYRNADGSAAYRVFRYRRPTGKKDFSVHPPDGKGGWKFGAGCMQGIHAVPYRLVEWLASENRARGGLVVEGEGKADRLAALGFVVTTAHGGRGNCHVTWPSFDPAWFTGRAVAILPDNNEAGQVYALTAARALKAAGASVRMVNLPGLLPGQDVADWLEAGHTADELRQTVQDAPGWIDPGETGKLPSVEANGHHGPARAIPALTTDLGTWGNCLTEWVEDKDGNAQPVRHPLSSAAVLANLQAIRPGWPKRAGDSVFIVEGPENAPVYLDSAPRLIAYGDSLAAVEWATGPRFVSQDRFHAYTMMNLEPRYDSIETLPHWPPIPGVYYAHRPLPPPNGRIAGFLDFFRPSTPEDRSLILAYLITLFWGGPPGKRPVFLITGPEDDPGRGRGIGKTTLAALITGGIAGGAIEASPKDEIADIKTRILSPGGQGIRCLRLDNVKVLRFSWGDFEGMTTADRISGRRLYKGEGQRPNTITSSITLNGASLSTDMTQRVVPIVLARPDFSPRWDDEVNDYIRRYRWEIIAEIGAMLTGPRTVLEDWSRWGPWENEVLSVVPLAESCRRLILTRRAAMDGDDEDTAEFRDYLETKLRERGHDPETCRVRIQKSIVAGWFRECTNDKFLRTNTCTTKVNMMGISQLCEVGAHKQTRYYEWRGVRADPALGALDYGDIIPDGGPLIQTF